MPSSPDPLKKVYGIDLSGYIIVHPSTVFVASLPAQGSNSKKRNQSSSDCPFSETSNLLMGFNALISNWW